MADACCINAYINWNLDHTIEVLQSWNIWQDICRHIQDYDDRAIDYICYIDKCGCHCCLSNENEIIIHTVNWMIKNVVYSSASWWFNVKRCDNFWWNRAKTVVRYRTDTYPTSPTDWCLWVEETVKNTYASSWFIKTGLSWSYVYIKLYALDSWWNILSECCWNMSLWTDKVYWYTWAAQSLTIPAWTYKLQVWWASWFCNASYVAWRWGWYAEWCITLTSAKTAYVYIWWHPTWQAWWRNWWGAGYSSYWMWWGWGTDIRIWGNTLCHRVIVAWWSWGNNCTLSCAWAQWWAWWWMYWMRGMDNTQASQWSNRDWWWAWPNYWGCAWSTWWSAWTFWQWWTSCSWYNAWGWWGGWYGWGWAYDNDGDNDWRWGWGWSWYVWTSANCQYHPAPACLSWIPYLTNTIIFCWAQTFTSPTWWTETWHFWHGCAKITRI